MISKFSITNHTKAVVLFYVLLKHVNHIPCIQLTCNSNNGDVPNTSKFENMKYKIILIALMQSYLHCIIGLAETSVKNSKNRE